MKIIGFGWSALVLALSLPASASIINGTVTGGTALTDGGTFVKLTIPLANPFGPPDSVGNDNFQSPNLYGFDEQQDVVLATPLVVDVGTSPIPAGTTIDSEYIFFDPGPDLHVIGTVNFDAPVLAIITGTGLLAGSDFLGNPGVNYLNPAARGLEAGDSVTISGPNQILFDTVASSPGDYVRVITAFSTATTTVPEPGSAALLAGILAALAWPLVRRRKVSA